MFRTIEDFQTAWGYEAEMTGKIFLNLTDESLSRKVNDEGRTLGYIAWHITITLGEMLGKVGLNIDAPAEDAECPTSAAEIARIYGIGGKSVGDEVAKNWNEEILLIEDDMYGETWSRGNTLFYLILHPAHHRGQMEVLMRQAGLKVPGIYGPSKEEWAAFGMPAMP